MDQRLGQNNQVTRGGEMPLFSQAGTVQKLRVDHAELPCQLVHVNRKVLLGTGNMLGHGNTGIIAGLDDNPPQQVA